MLKINKIIAIVFFAFCLISLARAEKKKEASQEGYQIEIEADTLEKKPVVRLSEPKELKFISPGGKVLRVVKTKPVRLISPRYEGYLFYAESPFKVSGNKKYALGIENVALEGNWIKMERVLWNAQGKKKWTKVWRTYPPEAEGDPNWDEGISYNGSTVYVSYKDSLRNYWLVVYDTLGKELVKVSNKYGFWDIGISLDGQLIGAYTILSLEDDNTLPDLFFLNVKTGKSKLVKGGGILNRKQWSAHFSFSATIDSERCLSKVYIGCGVENGPNWYGFLSIDEIPDDLSTLFSDGGEK